MVRPRYIICSEGRVVDRETKLVTYYNVIDSVTLSIPASEPEVPVVFGPAMWLSAVWMREQESEKEVEYETEVRLFPPGSDEPRSVFRANFRFGDYRFHRIDVAIRPGPPEVAGLAIKVREGTMRLECRIRPVGEGDWLSQEYVIPFNVHRLESLEAEERSSDT